MRSIYKRLGAYIQEVNIRNKDLNDYPLLGVSIKKVMMPSIANTVGTDMSSYKIIRRNQFAYGPVTSRNGDKISVALSSDNDAALLSQAYVVFETDETQLLPEYLMMWFCRPEFDRYARYMSHGSARETFDWQDMCEVELPIPVPEIQQQIVNEYNIIQKRIDLNNQLIVKLEETAQAVYKQWFVEFEFPYVTSSGVEMPYKSSGGEMVESKFGEIPLNWNYETIGGISSVKGGKRLPKGEELNDDRIGRPYIKVADMKSAKYLNYNQKIQFVSNEIQMEISRYIVNKNDLILSIVGTIGLVNIIHENLDQANLTENCVKIVDLKETSSSYLYHFLISEKGKKIIEENTVGGVQGKLPLYNIQSIPVVIPSLKVINQFDKIINGIDRKMINKILENQKLEELKELMLGRMVREN